MDCILSFSDVAIRDSAIHLWRMLSDLTGNYLGETHTAWYRVAAQISAQYCPQQWHLNWHLPLMHGLSTSKRLSSLYTESGAPRLWTSLFQDCSLTFLRPQILFPERLWVFSRPLSCHIALTLVHLQAKSLKMRKLIHMDPICQVWLLSRIWLLCPTLQSLQVLGRFALLCSDF